MCKSIFKMAELLLNKLPVASVLSAEGDQKLVGDEMGHNLLDHHQDSILSSKATLNQ